jgi:hypothetical protein
VAGATGDERNAGLPGEPAVGIGHVHGGGLVAHVNEVEANLERGVENRHDMVAGEREHAAAAEALERSGNDVGAAERLGHALIVNRSHPSKRPRLEENSASHSTGRTAPR